MWARAARSCLSETVSTQPPSGVSSDLLALCKLFSANKISFTTVKEWVKVHRVKGYSYNSNHCRNDYNRMTAKL
jgi:hypothetical protein